MNVHGCFVYSMIVMLQTSEKYNWCATLIDPHLLWWTPVFLTVIFLNDDDSFTLIIADVDTLWLRPIHNKADCKVFCLFRITVIDNNYPETTCIVSQENSRVNNLKVSFSSCIWNEENRSLKERLQNAITSKH